MAADPPPILVHLHIPKNAGTTLSRMIKTKLALWPPGRLVHHAETLGLYTVKEYTNRLEAIARLPERAKRRVRFFEAHAGFGLHERLPGPCRYLVMLREPVERALSVFSHQKAEGRIPAEMSLEDFVLHADPQRVWWVDDAQVRYLAGEGGEIVDVPAGAVPRDMLDVARRRLDEDVFFTGITERFDESVVLLRRRLGWRRCRYVTSNVTPGRMRRDEVPPDVLALLEARNRLDAELYHHGVERFEAAVAAEGEDFRRQLARFRARNPRHDRLAGRVFNAVPRARRLVTRLVGHGKR